MSFSSILFKNHQKHTVVFLLFIICFCSWSCNNVNKESLKFTDLSDSMLVQENLEAAEFAINKAIELDDKNYIAYNNLAMLNAKKKMSGPNILQPLLKAISINGSYLIGLYNISCYYYDNNDYSNAELYCTKYIENSTNDPTDKNIAVIYSMRGECFSVMKNYEESIKDFMYAIQLDPQLARAYKELGSVYVNLDRYEIAIKNYYKAIELDSNYAQAYNGLAICYDDGIKDFNKALKNYNRAIQLDSLSPIYYNNRGGFLYDNGYKKEAYQDLVKAHKAGHLQASEYLRKYSTK